MQSYTTRLDSNVSFAPCMALLLYCFSLWSPIMAQWSCERASSVCYLLLIDE
jgi:hypothetical protein